MLAIRALHVYITCYRMSIRQLRLGSKMDTAWFLAALDRAGASQADLARHLRLAPSAVSRMLKGDRQMKLLEAAQASAFLGVSQDELLRHAASEPGMAMPRADGPAGQRHRSATRRGWRPRGR